MTELTKAMDAERPAHPETPYDIGYNNGLTMAMAIAINMDAVPVVRCKDCIYRHTRPSCQGRRLDWYCPDGERREK